MNSKAGSTINTAALESCFVTVKALNHPNARSHPSGAHLAPTSIQVKAPPTSTFSHSSFKDARSSSPDANAPFDAYRHVRTSFDFLSACSVAHFCIVDTTVIH
jgi:hypothetical protein